MAYLGDSLHNIYKKTYLAALVTYFAQWETRHGMCFALFYYFEIMLINCYFSCIESNNELLKFKNSIMLNEFEDSSLNIKC